MNSDETTYGLCQLPKYSMTRSGVGPYEVRVKSRLLWWSTESFSGWHRNIPCVAKSSAAIVLTTWDIQVIAFRNKKRFDLLVPFQWLEEIEKANTFLCYLKMQGTWF